MTIVVDIDGTLCTQEEDYANARPIWPVIKRVRRAFDSGHTIHIWTARGTVTGIDWRALTEHQLKEWGVPYHSLSFGKPFGDVYVDDRGVNVVDWRFPEYALEAANG